MKRNVLIIRLMLVISLALLAMPGLASAQELEPNDPMPGALPVEIEPSIASVCAAEPVPATPPGVVPASVEAKLGGDCTLTVEKTVTLPPTPPTLDLVLMVDLSGSYNNDLPNIKGKAPNIFDGVRAVVADSQFGLATFVDYPFSPWGSAASGDYAYKLDQNLTTDKTTWVAAVNAMNTRYGMDTPESQYVALYQAATGAGQTVYGYTIPADQDPSWRDDVTHVIAITTDAPFHIPGDSGAPGPYPNPTRDATVTALNAGNIKVIAIKAPGSSTQMDDVANATGGAVTSTGNTSAEIVEAILNALEELTFTVTPVPVGCDPLQFTFSPASYTGVMGGESRVFQETIVVPSGTPSGDVVCQVEFRADDTVIGTQDVTIHVNEPPVADADGPYLVAVDSTIPLNGTGTDPDDSDLTYAWTADDGTFDDPGAEDPQYTAGSAAGIFALALQVTDPCGASDTADSLVVVYDPDAGFVTGGGWIDSLAGAYTPDPLLAGKATFGFVSKYKKGTSVPTGNTEFQFHAASLNFHSSSYDWLVVTGSNYAMFKGVGTINGIGEYRFRIWAGDDDPDTFRIKIWEEDELGVETVAYDNGFDQAIGGGSIVIHTKNK